MEIMTIRAVLRICPTLIWSVRIITWITLARWKILKKLRSFQYSSEREKQRLRCMESVTWKMNGWIWPLRTKRSDSRGLCKKGILGSTFWFYTKTSTKECIWGFRDEIQSPKALSQNSSILSFGLTNMNPFLKLLCVTKMGFIFCNPVQQ